jgi:phosphohistidine phosphatase SixA
VKQAEEVGRQLRSAGITRILCSPMVRTVQTADLVAQQLGLGANSICVEYGIVEEAKSFRGKTNTEPRPNWNPLVYPLADLLKYSTRIDADYKPLNVVTHIRDESVPNTVREVHESLTERDEITRDRCRTTLIKILETEKFRGETLLLVGHGATVGAMLKVFEKELPEHLRVSGEKSVSCYTHLVPIDQTNLMGAWKSLSGKWHSGNLIEGQIGAEDIADRG